MPRRQATQIVSASHAHFLPDRIHALRGPLHWPGASAISQSRAVAPRPGDACRLTSLDHARRLAPLNHARRLAPLRRTRRLAPLRYGVHAHSCILSRDSGTRRL